MKQQRLWRNEHPRFPHPFLIAIVFPQGLVRYQQTTPHQLKDNNKGNKKLKYTHSLKGLNRENYNHISFITLLADSLAVTLAVTG